MNGLFFFLVQNIHIVTKSLGIAFPRNPVVIPQKAALAVMRLLHTLIKATGPQAEANIVPAK